MTPITNTEELLGWKTEEELETPQFEGEYRFPEGDWAGTIERVDVYEVTPDDSRAWMLRFNDKTDRTAASAVVCDIKISEIEAAADGQQTPGNSVMDKKIFIEFDGQPWNDPEMTGNANWQLRASRGRLQKLAKAIGATETNFKGQVVPTAEFDEALRGGSLEGHSVEFSVWHKPWANGEGVNVNVGRYRQAV